MRLIDADDAVKLMREAEKEMKVVAVLGCKAIDFAVVPKFIEGMPTIDAVPVVRCKDCKWFRSNSPTLGQHCACSGMVTEHDDFCSYGERRSDD